MPHSLPCLRLFVAALCSLTAFTQAAELESDWSKQRDRVWVGPQFWANPMEDWKIEDGQLVCTRSGPYRNVHALTHQLSAAKGTLSMSVEIRRIRRATGKGTAGFAVGIRSSLGDYRSSLLRGRGLAAGVTNTGALFIGKPRNDRPGGRSTFAATGLKLTLDARPAENGQYTVVLTATDIKSGAARGKIEQKVDAEKLVGNVALVNNFAPPTRRPRANGEYRARFRFANWKMGGSKLVAKPEHKFGPILYAMHSLSRGVMKMTAQMPPVAAEDSQQVRLQVKEGDAWTTIAKSKIDGLSRTATFRVTKWNDKLDTAYRLAYTFPGADGKDKEYYFAGTVRRDPVDKESIVVAGFTGNQDTAFPNSLLVSNVTKHNPDVLLFTGDQIYENVGGYGIYRTPTELATINYLRKIYLWGWAFRDLMRDRVSLVLPDDHDVYQGNIWGNGGNSVPSMKEHAQGGYAMDKDWVNSIQRTQTSHHPDAFDPTPAKQGITVYYGDMLYGRISFAVLEDRKFKSGPEGNVNSWPGRPDHVRDPKIDVKKLDKPGLKLLGDRQLKFLNHWVHDWKGADIKIACSQTIFCNLANYHGGNQMYLVADLDSNGWPQTGRNKALEVLRQGFAFHYAGDQHLPSIVQHGIETWNDAGFSFCVPSTAAGYPRSWRPDAEGRKPQNRKPSGLPNTGEYRDGLGNLVTVHAIGNPAKKNRRPVLELLHDKSSGYGVVRLHKKRQEITIECWKLIFDADKPKADDQFPGWPLTITVADNYGRAAKSHLPTLQISGLKRPVVQVIDQSNGTTVYSRRIMTSTYRPRVFHSGKHTVRVGDPDTGDWKTIKDIQPTEKGTLRVAF